MRLKIIVCGCQTPGQIDQLSDVLFHRILSHDHVGLLQAQWLKKHVLDIVLRRVGVSLGEVLQIIEVRAAVAVEKVQIGIRHWIGVLCQKIWQFLVTVGIRLGHIIRHEWIVVCCLWTHCAKNIALVEIDHQIQRMGLHFALERRCLLVQLRLFNDKFLRVQVVEAIGLL